MKENEASHSAAIIAAHRAFDSARPSAERICYDPYAEQLIGRGFTVVGKFDLPGETALELFNAVVPGFHEFFLARTRYIDDHLETGIKNGLEQLVILGAGLRHRYSLSRMRPFRPDRFKEVKTGDRDSTRMPVDRKSVV